MGRFTAYVNPYMVVSPQGRYTKHIYIGGQRIVSKLGDLTNFGQDPRRVARAGQNVDGENGGVKYDDKYNAAYDSIKSRYKRIFDMPFNNEKPNTDPVNGEGFCCKDNSALRAGNIGKENENPEIYQYYYHSDHLGSTSFITNLDGEVAQHVEYLPFGEVFLEERNDSWNTPYLFNAKELDEETGLYYFGQRYLDPRTSLWISTDPLQEKYPDISTYAYCLNNPVRLIDPDGMEWEDTEGNKVTDHSKIKVYIFYDSKEKVMTESAKAMYAKAESDYGQGSAAMSNATTESDFMQDWGNMAGSDIRKVNLNYHGDAQTVVLGYGDNGFENLTSTGNGHTNESKRPATDINKLPQPIGNISNAQLNINTCRSNAKDDDSKLVGSKQTVMEAFAKSFGFATVRGTSAGVSYNRITKMPKTEWFFQSWDYMKGTAPKKERYLYPGKGLPPPIY